MSDLSELGDRRGHASAEARHSVLGRFLVSETSKPARDFSKTATVHENCLAARCTGDQASVAGTACRVDTLR